MDVSNMDRDVKIIKVELGERSYPIYIGPGLIDRVGELFKANLSWAKRCIVVTSDDIHRLHGNSLMESLRESGVSTELVFVPEGEKSKSWNAAGNLLSKLVDFGLDRQSVVVAFGGGAIGDLAGFVAAIYFRGLGLVHIPTTLLSQVDSSIGGKVAVNHPKGKNLIGAFYQPKIVITDLFLLKTLPHEEFLSGLAEVVKYGVISNADIFDIVEEEVDAILELNQEILINIVSRCCAVKARLVEQDERDVKGLRASLNYGHTVGHALEILTYPRMKHGEAVAAGMEVAARISKHLGLISKADLERQRQLLRQLGLSTTLPDIDPSKLLDAMRRDKKVESGSIRFVLPTGIGSPPILKAVQENHIIQALEGGDV